MLNFQYIMITNWARHWDDLGSHWGNSTIFTLPVIKDNLANGPWPQEATTLFIKRNKDHSFERSWIGKAKNFRPDPNGGKEAIRFEVSELTEVDCPPIFQQYPYGWHLNKSHSEIPTHPTENSYLYPAFFARIANSGWLEFEEYCFLLLRLLGIHEIHKYPQSDNRGKADGFFKFNTLSVLYDATLQVDFDQQKEIQVDNYIHQLKADKIRIGQQVYSINETNRQVWVITKNTAVRSIKREDQIKVKEIPYTKLIDIYIKRLNSEIGVDELEDLLKDLH